jgi:hypothetical protein
VVEALRDALLEREELIGDDILEVIRRSQPVASGSPASELAANGSRIALDASGPPA